MDPELLNREPCSLNPKPSVVCPRQCGRPHSVSGYERTTRNLLWRFLSWFALRAPHLSETLATRTTALISDASYPHACVLAVSRPALGRLGFKGAFSWLVPGLTASSLQAVYTHIAGDFVEIELSSVGMPRLGRNCLPRCCCSRGPRVEE